MRESNVLPRLHPVRLRIAKPFNDPNYIFELKHDSAITKNDRKQRLRELIDRNKPERIIYAQHVEEDGKISFQEVCADDLEGIFVKRLRRAPTPHSHLNGATLLPKLWIDLAKLCVSKAYPSPAILSIVAYYLEPQKTQYLMKTKRFGKA